MRSDNCLLSGIPKSASAIIQDSNKRGLEFSAVPNNARARFRDDERGAA